MPSPRRAARIAVMQTLFAYETHGGVPQDILQYVVNEYPAGPDVITFASTTLEGVLKYREEILPLIREFAVEWPLEKIAPVDRGILEIGTYEIMFSTEVPPIVAINEAIEVAKDYADVNAPKFINGVLSKILEKYCVHRDHKTGSPIVK
ncbi:MAG: transcription antitermination factor NusB [Candidatus Peregrinibacteria bacterium]|nr:transcription antitermination factor NusB [Candidatus Peregrinibacteria bacterium]